MLDDVRQKSADLHRAVLDRAKQLAKAVHAEMRTRGHCEGDGEFQLEGRTVAFGPGQVSFRFEAVRDSGWYHTPTGKLRMTVSSPYLPKKVSLPEPLAADWTATAVADRLEKYITQAAPLRAAHDETRKAERVREAVVARVRKQFGIRDDTTIHDHPSGFRVTLFDLTADQLQLACAALRDAGLLPAPTPRKRGK